jgi:nitric oxide reductase NorD protein
VSEPEEVITAVAHSAGSAARRFWAAVRTADSPLRLDDVRRRVELFAAAFFPEMPAIGTAEPPAPLPLLAKLAGAYDRAYPTMSLASVDAQRLRLPPQLNATAERAASLYQLLALEQAARADRRSHAFVPVESRLLRDLYLLSEAATIDAQLATLLPRLGSEIATARLTALMERSRPKTTPMEAAVERLVATLLAASPLALPTQFSNCDAPADSVAWAKSVATSLATLGGGRRYRGVEPVALWGTSPPSIEATPSRTEGEEALHEEKHPRSHTMRRRPRVRDASADQDDSQPGIWIVRADDPQESVEDPMGLQRPMDQHKAPDAAELGDALSDLRDARLVHTRGAPREVLASEEPVPRAPMARSRGQTARHAFVYPEWDYRSASYNLDGAVVRELESISCDSSSANQMLSDRASLVRQVRRDFERLRPQRELLTRQVDGSDVDIDAWVAAVADVAAARSPDQRFYLSDRRARRDTAIVLLMDASASTDSWVSGVQRVIDVERAALLIVSEALAALGDRHAIYAFRTQGSRRVDMLPIKRFADATGEVVRARIAGLAPDGYTRMGAAVRHTTALLASERAHYRLLLLLSDGRPNDVDLYEGTYGLEDTRQAFAEARAQEVHPFCVTVDRGAPAYASHVFGRGRHAMLRDPAMLPQVLVAALRRLLPR